MIEKGKWYLIRHGFSVYPAKCLAVFEKGAYMKVKSLYVENQCLTFNHIHGEIDNPTILHKIKRLINDIRSLYYVER